MGTLRVAREGERGIIGRGNEHRLQKIADPDLLSRY